MSAITVYAKLLSGEIIPLKVDPRISLKEMTYAVWHSLPFAIRPLQACHVVLMRGQGQEEEEELHDQDVLPFLGEEELHDQDVFPVLIIPNEYHLILSYVARAHHVEEDVLGAQGYDMYQIEILCNWEVIHYTYFFTTPFRFQKKEDFRFLKKEDHPVILPLTPSVETWTDDDQPDLEVFRLPPAPYTDPVAYYSVQREDLLCGISVPPLVRSHLLFQLNVLWQSHIRLPPNGQAT